MMLLRLLLILLSLPAFAEEGCPRRRHVDCAAAARAIAAAIAGAPDLAAMEAAIGTRLSALGAVLPPPAAAVLARDAAVRRRARARDLFFTPEGVVEAGSIDVLRDALAAELAHLGRIGPAPHDGLAGRWAGGFVRAEVTPLGGGRFQVSADAVEPYHLAWTCEFEDAARAGPDAVLLTEDGTLRLRRDGPLLRLEPIPRPGLAGYDYCGAMGSLAGALFYIGPVDQNPTQAPR